MKTLVGKLVGLASAACLGAALMVAMSEARAEETLKDLLAKAKGPKPSVADVQALLARLAAENINLQARAEAQDRRIGELASTWQKRVDELELRSKASDDRLTLLQSNLDESRRLLDKMRTPQVWGVNGNDQIYRYDNGVWLHQPGALMHVAVGPDGSVWGTNRAGRIYTWNGTQFQEVAGQGLLRVIGVGGQP